MQGFHYYLNPNPQTPHYINRSTMIAALSKLAPTVKGRMIDIGSGHSRGYEGLFKAYVNEYLCIDQQYAENVDLCGDCYNIPLPNDSVDTILSTQVLEHLTTPDRMLKEAYRLLKPGGQLILTAPMVWGLHEEPIDFYRYTQYGLHYLLESAEYSDINVQPLEGLFAVLMQLLIDEYYEVWLARNQRFGTYLITTLNRIALWLDRAFPTRRLCLTYLVTATKPGGATKLLLSPIADQSTPVESVTQAPSGTKPLLSPIAPPLTQSESVTQPSPLCDQTLSEWDQTLSNQTASSASLEGSQRSAQQSSLSDSAEPLKTQLIHLQATLENTQRELTVAQTVIAAMKTSKFWQMRMHWIRFKQWLFKSKDIS